MLLILEVNTVVANVFATTVFVLKCSYLFLLYVLRNFTLDIFQHIGGIIIDTAVLMRGKCLSYTEYTQKNGAI
jgi:hypothetical protein